jgi:hypothetical protein
MVSTDPATLAKVRRAIEEHGTEGAHIILRDSLLRGGASRETAESVSARDIARAQQSPSSPADLSDGMAGAPQSAVGDDAGLAGPYPGAGRPGYDRTLTNAEVLASRSEQDAGPGYQRVPAPRMPFGGPVPEPGMINDPEAIEDYTTREWDGGRNEYKPSPKDRAMAARGMVPVLNPDGSVGYSVGYPPGSITGENPNRFPGAAGRSGERQDLTDAGWKTETVPSPLGMQTVYRPGDRQAKQIEGVDKRRLARRAGIPSAQAQGMDIDQLRLAAQGAADDDAIARRASWKAQAMLAGGQPTGGRGGSKAVTNALMMLPENERNQSLRYMLPGGQFAAAVDAQNMQNANDVIKRFMTSGAAAGMNNPLANAQAQMAQQQADAAKPVQVRAQEHVASGRLNHPDVLQHADDLVNTHYSSRPGALGVSSRFTDNEVMLAAQRLADDTGMPVAEAEKLMRRIQADRNRNSVASSFVAGFYDQ